MLSLIRHLSSPAESRLAAMLLEGGTARDVARRMALSYQTVRNQLKSLFEKTGTARQSELVKLLVRFSR
jgi:DNA-binding CsgD family transcriptional regulator